MIFAPVRLGETSLNAEAVAADKKSCKRFGPCGVGKEALFLNSYFIDRRYYVAFSSVRRVFKRVAMSQGGFSGKGVFGAIPYLVVQYDGGKEKQCTFKREEDVDAMLAYIGEVHPEIPTLSVGGEQRLEQKAKEEAEKAKEKLEELQKAADELKKAADEIRKAAEEEVRKAREELERAQADLEKMRAELEQAKKDAAAKEQPSVSVGRVTLKKVAKSGKGAITVTWKKVSGAEGYQIQCAGNRKFKKAVNKETARKNKIKVKKLRSGRRYYVRVRAYKKAADGTKIYGKYSRLKKITVK